MITAEDFYDENTNGFLDRNDCERLMIEFAKLHVETALKEASERNGKYFILNAYPLDLIK